MNQTGSPAAPATSATLAAAPPYVIPGTWDDYEWRAVAARRDKRNFTEAEKYLYVGGPRPHPWGAAAFYGKLTTGEDAIFPSRAAHDAHHDAAAAAAAAAEAPGNATLTALNQSLAQHTDDA